MTQSTSPALPVFRIDWGLQGLLRLIASFDFKTVLDIGSGAGEHARLLRHLGKTVTTIDLNRDADIMGDYATTPIDDTFDVVWCSHVLEHQRNVGSFLEKLAGNLADDGILAISVPTHPAERMVAGHVTAWNAGLLVHNLVLAGFDCRDAILSTTVDLSLIVRKRPARAADVGGAAGSGADLDPGSGGDPFGPIAPFFPFPVTHGGNAVVEDWNWGGYSYRLPADCPPFRLTSRFLPEEGLLIGGAGPTT